MGGYGLFANSPTIKNNKTNSRKGASVGRSFRPVFVCFLPA